MDSGRSDPGISSLEGIPEELSGAEDIAGVVEKPVG